ncbi:hypothetical protein ABI_29670 [Asticcacaulis biprosthecium C19]|uniref:Uncharacterized protein n=1 Tax=Asticcacaulis biprosthecium C19 TaxID=715226 RepID=F4QMV9_9CAUL|nr:hypothetical protein ABI_29670 [Asticcacaulis biprosthecium C19]
MCLNPPRSALFTYFRNREWTRINANGEADLFAFICVHSRFQNFNSFQPLRGVKMCLKFVSVGVVRG